ncbi:hypothetical protein D3C74_335560 [compost metagenome]
MEWPCRLALRPLCYGDGKYKAAVRTASICRSSGDWGSVTDFVHRDRNIIIVHRYEGQVFNVTLHCGFIAVHCLCRCRISRLFYHRLGRRHNGDVRVCRFIHRNIQALAVTSTSLRKHDIILICTAIVGDHGRYPCGIADQQAVYIALHRRDFVSLGCAVDHINHAVLQNCLCRCDCLRMGKTREWRCSNGNGFLC